MKRIILSMQLCSENHCIFQIYHREIWDRHLNLWNKAQWWGDMLWFRTRRGLICTWYIPPIFLLRNHGIINANIKLLSGFSTRSPVWLLMQIRLKARHHNLGETHLIEKPCSREHHHRATGYCWKTRGLPVHTLTSWQTLAGVIPHLETAILNFSVSQSHFAARCPRTRLSSRSAIPEGRIGPRSPLFDARLENPYPRANAISATREKNLTRTDVPLLCSVYTAPCPCSAAHRCFLKFPVLPSSKSHIYRKNSSFTRAEKNHWNRGRKYTLGNRVREAATSKIVSWT